jgi:hypothetical protein
MYARWMNQWENDLCFRATDRVVRPFEWGLEWTRYWPVTARLPRNGLDGESWLRKLNQVAIEHSDEFFGYPTPKDFSLEGDFLRFTSPAHTPYPENNCVHAKWFPAEDHKKRAVIVLPHWNARADQHEALCRGIQKFGVSTLRLSLPYHDYRMPAELNRADYAVSANIGRTLDATRQAVIDVRCCLDWLAAQGYERFGIVGTSLGSCYAFLASAHDARIKANIFNHCSSYFGDVVWTGLSTLHIRQSVEEHITRDRLREAWQVISPVNYMAKYAAHPHKKQIFIYARYDTTFLPELSEDILAFVNRHQIPHKKAVLPCGHYTLGETPFKFMDGYLIVSHLLRWL